MDFIDPAIEIAVFFLMCVFLAMLLNSAIIGIISYWSIIEVPCN